MTKRSKQYFRFTVDQTSGKWTKHTTHLVSDSTSILISRDDNEIIPRPDHDLVDEVVIDGWFHLEAMSRREYWMNVGGVTVWVTLRKDGTVKQVRAYEAGEYDEPWPNVDYGYKNALSKKAAKKEAKKARKLRRTDIGRVAGAE